MSEANAARPGVCLVTSSYPSPAAPTRGAFVEDIALGLLENGPVAVVAPLIYPTDPAAEVRKEIPVTRFAFGSTGRLLKEYGGTPTWLMLRYMMAGVLATLRAARPARCVFAHWVVPTGVIAAAAPTSATTPSAPPSTGRSRAGPWPGRATSSPSAGTSSSAL